MAEGSLPSNSKGEHLEQHLEIQPVAQSQHLPLVSCPQMHSSSGQFLEEGIHSTFSLSPLSSARRNHGTCAQPMPL